MNILNANFSLCIVSLAVIINRLEAHVKSMPHTMISYLHERVHDIHYQSSQLLIQAYQKREQLTLCIQDRAMEIHWSW